MEKQSPHWSEGTTLIITHSSLSGHRSPPFSLFFAPLQTLEGSTQIAYRITSAKRWKLDSLSSFHCFLGINHIGLNEKLRRMCCELGTVMQMKDVSVSTTLRWTLARSLVWLAGSSCSRLSLTSAKDALIKAQHSGKIWVIKQFNRLTESFVFEYFIFGKSGFFPPTVPSLGFHCSGRHLAWQAFLIQDNSTTKPNTDEAIWE